MMPSPVGTCARCGETIYKDCTGQVDTHRCPPLPVTTTSPPSETGPSAEAGEACGHKAGGCENASTGTRDGLCSACFCDHCDHEEQMISAAFAKAAAPTVTRMGAVYTDEQIAVIKMEAKRSAHLEDAHTAHEEGVRMHRAAGEARRNGRVSVAHYRDSDSETAGRIADLILAKVPK